MHACKRFLIRQTRSPHFLSFSLYLHLIFFSFTMAPAKGKTMYHIILFIFSPFPTSVPHMFKSSALVPVPTLTELELTQCVEEGRDHLDRLLEERVHQSLTMPGQPWWCRHGRSQAGPRESEVGGGGSTDTHTDAETSADSGCVSLPRTPPPPRSSSDSTAAPFTTPSPIRSRGSNPSLAAIRRQLQPYHIGNTHIPSTQSGDLQPQPGADIDALQQPSSRISRQLFPCNDSSSPPHSPMLPHRKEDHPLSYFYASSLEATPERPNRRKDSSTYSSDLITESVIEGLDNNFTGKVVVGNHDRSIHSRSSTEKERIGGLDLNEIMGMPRESEAKTDKLVRRQLFLGRRAPQPGSSVSILSTGSLLSARESKQGSVCADLVGSKGGHKRIDDACTLERRASHEDFESDTLRLFGELAFFTAQRGGSSTASLLSSGWRESDRAMTINISG